jgi:hypothetical protein
MNFRTNQVLQFYVNNDKNTVALVDKTADKGIFWFTNTQNGKVVSRTDVVEKDKVLYATYATAASMQIPTKKFTVAAPAEVVAGQDYVVKVEFTNYQGMGDMDMTVKVGAAHATANTDVKKLMDEIAWTLEKNLKAEYAPLVTVTVDGSNNLVIEEALQNEWILGVTPNEGVNFRVYVAPIVVDGEEIFDWTTITKDNGAKVIKNGRKMADLEYFAMGERGDQYRMVGWPNVIRTNYLIDPEKEYDAITIHYAFVDSNEGVQKSERDLMIVGEAAKLASIKTFVEGLGVKFIEKA